MCMMLLITTNLNAQNYRVQVATYDTGVPSNYFSAAGLDNVIQEIDVNGFYRYYKKKNYATQNEAIKAQEEAISKGFENASVIDLEKLREECSSPCGSGYYSGLVVGMIFFDFDKDFLRGKSKDELDVLHQILTDNPAFNVVIDAHTDSKGTDEYNINLSQRRANSAKKYLIARGITSSRITTSINGEKAPIAKNATTDGKDLPEGRQYNRRVEFVLKDADNSVRSDMVEEVPIPDYLKAY